MAKFAFAVEDTTPIDIHFESMGFRTSDTIMNLSSIIFLVVLIAVVGNLLYLVKQFGPSDNPVVVYLSTFKSSIVSKGVNMFIDWSFLFVTLCCTISLYQRHVGEYVYEPSYFVALTLIVMTPIYLIALFSYLIW